MLNCFVSQVFEQSYRNGIPRGFKSNNIVRHAWSSCFVRNFLWLSGHCAKFSHRAFWNEFVTTCIIFVRSTDMANAERTSVIQDCISP